MPRDIPHFTRCVDPTIAHSYSVGGAVGQLIAGAGFGYLVAYLVGIPCAGITAAVAGLVAVIDDIDYWFYNERLMCVAADQCAAGTIIGIPAVACDGDAKLDTLIAPFGFLETDATLMSDAIAAVAVQPGIPAPPPDFASNRDSRLAYVEAQLTYDQRVLLYLELVNNHMLNQPGRDYQGPYYKRLMPPMSQLAFDHSGPDSNPMFRFDRDDPAEEQGPIDKFFCQTVLDVSPDEGREHRLVPFLHCEIEGNRLHRALTNLRVALVAFAASFTIACAICEAITLGAGSFLLCNLVAGAIAAFLAWLIWLLSNLFNDPNDGTAGNLPFTPPDPTAPDEATSGAAGDVVLIFGDWVKDTEHGEYFEIHPVKAWFLICRDVDGGAVLADRPNDPTCAFDVRELTEQRLTEMCEMVTRSETQDPPTTHVSSTSVSLSLVGGLG